MFGFIREYKTFKWYCIWFDTYRKSLTYDDSQFGPKKIVWIPFLINYFENYILNHKLLSKVNTFQKKYMDLFELLYRKWKFCKIINYMLWSIRRCNSYIGMNNHAILFNMPINLYQQLPNFSENKTWSYDNFVCLKNALWLIFMGCPLIFHFFQNFPRIFNKNFPIFKI